MDGNPAASCHSHCFWLCRRRHLLVSDLHLQSSRAAGQVIRDTILNWLSRLLVFLGGLFFLAQGDDKSVYCHRGRRGSDYRVQSSACSRSRSRSRVSSWKSLCWRSAAAGRGRGRGVRVLERVYQGRVRLRKGMYVCVCVYLCVCTGAGMASAFVSKFEVISVAAKGSCKVLRWRDAGKFTAQHFSETPPEGGAESGVCIRFRPGQHGCTDEHITVSQLIRALSIQSTHFPDRERIGPVSRHIWTRNIKMLVTSPQVAGT